MDQKPSAGITTEYIYKSPLTNRVYIIICALRKTPHKQRNDATESVIHTCNEFP